MYRYFNVNHTTLIFIVFSFLTGTLVFAIWSNTHVFAQQLPSVSSSSASPAAGNRSSSSSSSSSNAILPALKAKMCDPRNPGLKVVNTTEARICGIPKTVKPSLLSSAATPPTSATISSSSPPLPSPQTTTTTKPTTSSTNAATPTPKQQQQIAATNKNNTSASSRSTTNSVVGATIAPVSNPSNKSLSSTSPLPSPSAIAPQVKAINQQQQEQSLTRINSTTTEAAINSTAPQVKAVNEQQQQSPASSPITPINGTDGQNYTFVASPPVVSSGKLLYLGYHDGGSSPTKGGSSPNDKRSSDSKPSTPHIKITAPDNDSISRKTTSTTKLSRSDITTNDNVSSKERSEPDTKPFNSLPHIKITAPDNDSTEKEKEKTSSAKLDRDDSTKGESSFKKDKSSSFDSRSSRHTTDGSESLSSSDLASAFRNKVDSIIINSPGEVRHNLFGFSDHGF
jgi:hypothetical protein